MDDDIGWNDFALRNYDPQIGRWVQQDPYQEFASPYVGMGNDPVNNMDPSGGNAFSGLTIAGKLTVTTLGGAIIGAAADLLSGGDGWAGAAVGAGIGLAGGLINNLTITAKVLQAANVAVTIINTSTNTQQAGRQAIGSNTVQGDRLGHGPNAGNPEGDWANYSEPIGQADKGGECCKGFWESIKSGVKWINNNLNPLVPATEFITGRSLDSDFKEKKPRLESLLQTGTFLVPSVKVETIIGNQVKNVVVKQVERQVLKRAAKGVLPTLDATGKLHGILPKIKDFGKYSKDELQILLKELKQSVQKRIQVTSKIGRDRAHGQRQGAEQDLIKSLEKYLGL